MSALSIPQLDTRTRPSLRARSGLRLVTDVPTTSTSSTRTAVVAPRPAGLAPRSRAQAWRRRTGALLLVSSLLVLLVQLVLPAAAPAPDVVPVASVTVVVQPGDTLWSIAASHAPDGVGTGAFVQQLAELNGLDGSSVDVWDVLLLPAG